MKKRFLIVMLLTSLFLLLLRRHGAAFQTTAWISSNTATADSFLNLCEPSGGSGSSIRCMFHGICINTSSPGNLAIYNSSGVVSNIIATVSTSSAVPCNFYDVDVSSGLTYNKTGTADVTILFNRY
jgi:hypothetical protein